MAHAVVSRRELLTALGGAGAVSRVRTGQSSAVADVPPVESVHVRVYPGPVPHRVRLRNGVVVGEHWTPAHRDALAAVADAFEQIREYARERSRLEHLEVRVDRGEVVRLPPSAASGPSDAVVPSLETMLSGFQDRLRKRDALTGSAVHLLLPWSPLNYRVGYGGTLSPNARVGDDADGSTGDALTVANVGATERWDSRAITRNMAIHEVLHTFLSGDVAASVGGSRCDHDLGTAVETVGGTMRVSPIATAYAGPDEIGSGTRFPGTGCVDHDAFHRHDGLEGVENWTYTTELSEATLEGVTRYLERRVV